MDTSKWRPEGWYNPYYDEDAGGNKVPDEGHYEFEAGADAMLEALRKEGIHIQWAKPGFNIPDIVVFIPDEVE